MYLPQNAKIEEIGLHSLDEIENHRVSGIIFVQYRVPIHDKNNKVIDAIVNRFELPVCIYNSSENPDLRELTLTQIEDLFYIEVNRVFKSLPNPIKRVDSE